MMKTVFDFNLLPTYSQSASRLVTVVVEIPADGQEKIEWDFKTKTFAVQRNLSCALPKLVNYGFIPQSLAGDGDHLDVLLLTRRTLKTGQVLAGQVLGVMLSEDEGQEDHKIIAVLDDDPFTENELDNIKLELIHFFNNYKEKAGQYLILGWQDQARAHQEITKAQKRWQNTPN